MNKLVISPEAARDLEKINQYIIYELKNPSAARQVVRSIIKDLRILEHYAEAGPSVAALTGYSSDLRILVSGNYIAAYKVEGNTVLVARVINARQDYINVLFGDNISP